MREARHNSGLTLVEMLVVISILVLLTTIVWRVNAGITTQADLRSQQRAFDLLGDAVEVYLEVYQTYQAQTETLPELLARYPRAADEPAMLTELVTRTEGLYAQLYAHPESRAFLSRLHTGCVTDLPTAIASNDAPEIRDVWGTPLFYQSTESFPLFVSAGPDRHFGTPDDVTNR